MDLIQKVSISKWFQKVTGSAIVQKQKQFKKTVGDVPLVGTVDGVVVAMGSGGKVLNTSSIIEAKHTNPFNTMDDMIERYMPQIQLYCHVSGAEGCHLSVIFGNSKWQSAFVHYDEDYFNKMMVFINDFWWHVVNDKEPVGMDTPEDININNIPVDNMVVRDASTDNAHLLMHRSHTSMDSSKTKYLRMPERISKIWWVVMNAKCFVTT